MDYKAFFAEVAEWILQVNNMAMKHTMDSSEFWQWVSDSIAAMGTKYGNNKLVIHQMSMLFMWLEEVYEESKGGN